KIVVTATPPTATTVNVAHPGDVLPADASFIAGKLWGQQNIPPANATATAPAGNYLTRIDPVTGAVDRFAQTVIPNTTAAGAAWTFGNGNLGLSNNADGTIYQIAIANPNSATPTFTLVASATGPASGSNDATSCLGDPVDLVMHKSASPSP